MARKYHYLKSQVTNGLYTPGNEFQIEETKKEYKGLYHRYYDGEIYTGYKYDRETSKRLVRLQRTISAVQLPDTSEYDDITTFGEDNVRKWITPQPRKTPPTEKDYEAGWMNRYFVKKSGGENRFFEITKQTYSQFKSNQIDPIWSSVSINWKITGPIRDIIQNGIIKFAGVTDENFRTLRNVEVYFPNLSLALPNLREYWRPPSREFSI